MVSYFTNSLVIALTSTVIALIIGVAGGYAFARYRFRFKGGIFLGLMLFRAVPGIALSLPVFMMWSRLGLDRHQDGADHRLCVLERALHDLADRRLLPPRSRQQLSEAAQVDGCTRWQAFWKIEFPLGEIRHRGGGGVRLPDLVE